MNVYPSLGWVHAVGLKKCVMNCVYHNRLYLLKPNSHYCMNFRLNVSNSYELILFNSRQKNQKRFLKFQAWKLNAKRDLEHVIKHCLINRQLSKTPREQHLKLQIRRGKPYSEKVTVEKSSYNFDLHLVLKFHRNLVATLKDRVQGHRFVTV